MTTRALRAPMMIMFVKEINGNVGVSKGDVTIVVYKTEVFQMRFVSLPPHASELLPEQGVLHVDEFPYFEYEFPQKHYHKKMKEN